jgi:DNA-binding NtrC family response regulator
VTAFWEHIRRAARQHIQQALDEYGSVANAAAALKMNRTHLYVLMKKLGMRTGRQEQRTEGNAEWRSLGF